MLLFCHSLLDCLLQLFKIGLSGREWQWIPTIVTRWPCVLLALTRHPFALSWHEYQCWGAKLGVPVSRAAVTNYGKLRDWKWHKRITWQFWELTSETDFNALKSICQKGCFLCEILGENLFSCLFQLLAISCGPWLMATSPIFKPLVTSPVLLTLCPSGLFCLPFIRLLVIAIRDHQIGSSLHLKILNHICSVPLFM